MKFLTLASFNKVTGYSLSVKDLKKSYLNAKQPGTDITCKYNDKASMASALSQGVNYFFAGREENSVRTGCRTYTYTPQFITMFQDDLDVHQGKSTWVVGHAVHLSEDISFPAFRDNLREELNKVVNACKEKHFNDVSTDITTWRAAIKAVTTVKLAKYCYAVFVAVDTDDIYRLHKGAEGAQRDHEGNIKRNSILGRINVPHGFIRDLSRMAAGKGRILSIHGTCYWYAYALYNFTYNEEATSDPQAWLSTITNEGIWPSDVVEFKREKLNRDVSIPHSYYAGWYTVRMLGESLQVR